MTLQDDLIALAKVKERINDLGEEKDEIEARLVAGLRAAGLKSTTGNGGDLKGTLVEGTRVTIDEGGLKKALGAKLWGKVTKRVLDKEKLEAAIVSREVDAVTVASVSKETDVKPYIKVSGSYRPRKKAVASKATVTRTNSQGAVKPAARKRVARPKK